VLYASKKQSPSGRLTGRNKTSDDSYLPFVEVIAAMTLNKGGQAMNIF
jgi:hypothetical protein